MLPADADALIDWSVSPQNPFTVQLADLEESKASGLIEVIRKRRRGNISKKWKALTSTKTWSMWMVATWRYSLQFHGTVKCWLVVLWQADFWCPLLKLKPFQMLTSTVKSPNPENCCFCSAEELGRKVVDVLVATDPDDRLVEIRQTVLTSTFWHQIGAIIAKYILESSQNSWYASENAALCKSIVSTERNYDCRKLRRDYV